MIVYETAQYYTTDGIRSQIFNLPKILGYKTITNDTKKTFLCILTSYTILG